jgi:hypothetical protein
MLQQVSATSQCLRQHKNVQPVSTIKCKLRSGPHCYTHEVAPAPSLETNSQAYPESNNQTSDTLRNFPQANCQLSDWSCQHPSSNSSVVVNCVKLNSSPKHAGLSHADSTVKALMPCQLLTYIAGGIPTQLPIMQPLRSYYNCRSYSPYTNQPSHKSVPLQPSPNPVPTAQIIPYRNQPRCRYH